MAGLSITEQPALNQEQTRGRFDGQVGWHVLAASYNDDLKVAIVTGGAGGIGGMIVQRFLSDGAAVAILDMNEERGKEKIDELKAVGLDTKAK